jgi:hypothetical protein
LALAAGGGHEGHILGWRGVEHRRVSTRTRAPSRRAAEVANKCVALTAKAYPPRVPGNPAAGLAKGTAQSARNYYNKYMADNGNMDERP